MLKQISEGLDPFQPYMVLAHTFPGASAGDKIRAAVTANAATGAIIDCRGFVGVMVLDVDIAGGLVEYNRQPFTFLWGPNEVRVPVTQGYRSHHHHILHGTTFISKDASGARVLGVNMFHHAGTVGIGGPGNGITTTSGSNVVVKTQPANVRWGYLEEGQTVGIFSRLPRNGARDNTTLTVAPGAGDASFTVVSTAGFPASGYLRCENEIVFYTNVDATHFNGLTRGIEGSTAAAHGLVAVDRVVHEAFVVSSIAGNNITLADEPEGPANLDLNATNVTIQLGPKDVRFDGVGTFDGFRDPAADDAGNPIAIGSYWGRHIYIGPGIVFRNYDFGSLDFQQCTDSWSHANVERCGRAVGAGLWVFGGNKRVHIRGTFEECGDGGGVAIDDRSTGATLRDNACVDCTAIFNYRGPGNRGGLVAGGVRCVMIINDCIGINAGTAGIVAQSLQWITNPTPVGNEFGVVNFQGGAGAVAVSLDNPHVNARNHAWCHTPGALVQTPNPTTAQRGASLSRTKAVVPATLGATITLDAAEGDAHHIVDNAAGVARTIQIANEVEADEVWIFISNTSGGVLGAYTFGGTSTFKLEGAWVQPANGNGRWLRVRRRASAWREAGRSVADQPN